MLGVFFSNRRRHTRCALVTGVQTCALPILPYAKVPAFMVKLAERESFSRLALRFAILTAVRSGEVRGAAWEEFDLEEKLWTIPAARMKASREHVIPLSAPALAILERCRELRIGSSADRRGGKECVSKCRSRWSPYH